MRTRSDAAERIRLLLGERGEPLGERAALVVVGADQQRYPGVHANPGTEGFYRGLGFLRMNTAMAIWSDPARAIESGLLSAES